MYSRGVDCLQGICLGIVLFQFSVMDSQCDPIAVIVHREDVGPHQGVAILVGMMLNEGVCLRIIEEQADTGCPDPDFSVFPDADGAGAFPFDIIFVGDGVII